MSCRRWAAGFGLSEAMISLFLFAVASLYALPTYVVIIEQQKKTALKLAATQFAESLIEELKQAPWNELSPVLQVTSAPPFQRFAIVCDQATQIQGLETTANYCDSTTWGELAAPKDLACDGTNYTESQKEIKVMVTFFDNRGVCHHVSLAHLKHAS